MSTALPSPSPEQWCEYEGSSMGRQQEFLKKYKDDFGKMPIIHPQSIQKGDHLVVERGWYDHHMLCTERCAGDQFQIIEYTGPASGISASSKSVSFKDLGVKERLWKRRIHSKSLWRKWYVDHNENIEPVKPNSRH